MFSSRKFFLLAFLLASLCVFAQDNPLEKNEQDKIYTPDKNSIFSNGATGSSDNSSHPESEIHNAIKFNPTLLLLRNITAFYYERSITNGLTVQGGFGVCNNSDKIMQVGVAGDILLSQPKSTIRPDEIMSKGRFLSGTMVSASLRIYYSNYYNYYESFNSGYFEVGLRAYSNKFTLDNNVPVIYNGNSSYPLYPYTTGGTVLFNNTLFFFNYGYELCTSGKIKTTHDFYIGFGIKSTSFDKFIPQQEYIPDQQGQQQLVYVNVKYGRESFMMPAILFGYVFGFGW